MDELAFLPATEQARLVRAGDVSPVELVELYLERIERLDPELGAYVTVRGEQAVAEAQAKAHEQAEAPFHGVPISLKDLDTTAGTRTTFSCVEFESNVPDFDLAHVRRLKEAGFVVLGKTNTPEFGTTAFTDSTLNGPCRTPWDLRRNAGGSSGGAAAALAAGLCPIAQGSDGGGSIRIPASCCGVLGFKASRGRVSAAPFVAGIGLGTTGPLARTTADAAAYLDVVCGYEWGDPYPAPPPERPFAEEVGADPGRLRVALTTVAPIQAEVDPACVAAARDAAELLASLGHEVEETAPDWGGPGLMDEFKSVWQIAPTMYPISDPSALMPLNRAFLDGALQTSSAVYAGSLARLQLRSRKIVSLWADLDLLLTPTLALPPVPVGWESEPQDPWEQFDRAAVFTPFTAAFNVTGQPAVSVPLHWNDEGLPIGVQLVGPPLGDALLLRVASQLEAARPWAGRQPPHS
ncbi:MAG: amidase [Actinobacteria bacterium]|nr:amidase [Actinomycetota bacterium]